MATVSCPRECPSVPTLLADCGGTSSASPSTLFLASSARRRRRLRPESDAESCSQVSEVETSTLSGLNIQAVELQNSTLTELYVSSTTANLTDNSVADASALLLPETLRQLYLGENQLTTLEIPESWGQLELLDVSDNPIANISAAGKDGPRILIARNTSLKSLDKAAFPDSVRQLDLSLTTIGNWGNFTPPTDLSKLDLSGNNITTIQGVRFPRNLQTLLLNGSSVTKFEVCKSDVEVLERLETFNVTAITLPEDACSDAATPKTVTIANETYTLCVLTDTAFDEKYHHKKASSSMSLTTLSLLLFSLASAVFVLLMLFVIKRKQVAPEKAKSVRELQRFTREIRLYASLNHPKIVAFRGISWSSLADLSLVIEYMPNGDLAQFLERQRMLDSQRRGWNWTTEEDSGFAHSKLTVALDIADALVYLHSFAEPIMHRDLKAQNVLLSNKWVAKISDFGVSKRRKQRDDKRGVSSGGPQTAEVGTAAWIAPEVIKGARYDQKADIYSFGIVMCELDTCTKPYTLGVASSLSASGMTSFVSSSSATDEELKSLLSSNAALALAVSEKGVTPAFHSDCPRAILDLARMCLSYDPEDRPTAKELWRLLQDLAAPGALLVSSRKATLTESIRHVSTSA
ncbi:hypothetical protein PHYSODRAFT_533809 [Phytophthora sojae]|uniref:Protein kinase domain-containing protein n=1 Tax=Phytophthora sojae (strain P6497) TaxID=1094619 RepID=G5AFQ6_PHYSP|nr:hypothetical protein PHYSODRAFT_533809 [Phytophthora sojae]EGZ05422.1 hypothetical protein PHYSODRAFT_533809 [Phytophthora sojae]|eukprot:XP_009538953.1 hypothetical protein PHYSODRAFT_533809 [Phytophthora sojae]